MKNSPTSNNLRITGEAMAQMLSNAEIKTTEQVFVSLSVGYVVNGAGSNALQSYVRSFSIR